MPTKTIFPYQKKTLKHLSVWALATALKLLDSLWFAKSKKSSSNNKVHLEPSVNFNFAYLKQILNHNLSQLKAIADKDKLIIELIQLEEKMIAKIG